MITSRFSSAGAAPPGSRPPRRPSRARPAASTGAPSAARSAPRCRPPGAWRGRPARRRAPTTLEAAQVGRDAAVAAAEALQHLVPDEGGLGKAVQEAPARGAPGAAGARQDSVMPCGSARSKQSDAPIRRWRPSACSAHAPRRPRRVLLRAPRTAPRRCRPRRWRSSPSTACARAQRGVGLAARLSLSALVSSTSSLTAPLPHARRDEAQQLAGRGR